MTDENRTTFDNYIKLIDRAEFLKHKVYDHIITELSDLNFLAIQLGKYQALYIKAIKDNLPKFESIVNTEIEVNNYDKIKVDAILTQKQKAESLVNSILEFSKDNANIFQKTNEEFETYFKSLYDKTNNDYKGKNREFLQKKADEITKALHDAKHNYTINEFAENHIFDLKYLRTEIETEILKGIEAGEAVEVANEKPKPASKEVLSEQITHPKKNEIAKAIKDKYSSYKGKDFKILYEALLQLDLFPKKGKRSTYFRCLKNEHYNINNKQMLEEIYFKKGSFSARGNYQPSTDEIQRDGIIEYLKTIIDTN